MTNVHLRIGLLSALVAIAGCGGPSPTDAGVDLDTPAEMTDAGTDAPVIPSDTPADSGVMSDTPPAGDAVITIADGCPAFSPCGGDPIGTWQYDSICIEESGIEALFAAQCPGTEILSGTGTADGLVEITATQITRMITTSVTAQVAVGGDTCIGICAAIPSVVRDMVPGATATCVSGTDGAGNDTCTCDVTFGSTLDETNAYTTEGNTIVTDAGTPDERRFDYCVEGDGSLRYTEPGGEPGVSTSHMM